MGPVCKGESPQPSELGIGTKGLKSFNDDINNTNAKNTFSHIRNVQSSYISKHPPRKMVVCCNGKYNSDNYKIAPISVILCCFGYWCCCCFPCDPDTQPGLERWERVGKTTDAMVQNPETYNGMSEGNL